MTRHTFPSLQPNVPGERTSQDGLFGRLTPEGYVAVLHQESGEAATRMDNNLYPVEGDPSLSVRYEHPEGIVISRQDAERIGLWIEDES